LANLGAFKIGMSHPGILVLNYQKF